MFSSQEYQYIRDLTVSYYNQEYTNYVCYTNNLTNSYNTQYYDVYCYFSKSEIIQNGYTFSFGTDTKKCSIDTKSSTSNYKSSTLSCIDDTNSITVNEKEFIYSNVGYNSNIISDYEKSIRYYSNNNLYMTSLLSLLCVFFLYIFLSKVFKR